MESQLSPNRSNKIRRKCRETIPLVQVCSRFELSYAILKLLSKIWDNPRILKQIITDFGVCPRKMAPEYLWNTRTI